MGEQDLHSPVSDTSFASGAWDSDEAFAITDGDLHSFSGGYCLHDMALDCTTIVTDAGVDDGEFNAAPVEEEGDGEEDTFHDECCDDEILNHNDDDEVPEEVKVSFWEGNDNDDSTCHDQRGHEVVGDDSADDESSSSDCSSEEEEESDEEEVEEEGEESEVLDGDEAEEGVEEEEEEEEDSDSEVEEEESDEELDLPADDDDSVGEYETDEDSLDADRDPMDDASSCSCATSCHLLDDVGDNQCSRHELFLPLDITPSTESLKYEEDDEDNYSSDEDSVDNDRNDDRDDQHPYSLRTYIIGQNNRNSGRPRMWDGCPSIASISSSCSSSGSSQGSRSSSSSSSSSSKKRKKSPDEPPGRRGVTFSNSVTVYPVFKTAVYTPAMVTSMYTKREELRLNKIRNKREFAYELHDWRNAAEEEEMEANDRGELIHPVHAVEKRKGGGRPPSPKKVVQTYSSALGGYIVGSMRGPAAAYRAKRVRMYYP